MMMMMTIFVTLLTIASAVRGETENPEIVTEML